MKFAANTSPSSLAVLLKSPAGSTRRRPYKFDSVTDITEEILGAVAPVHAQNFLLRRDAEREHVLAI